ncbi:MAG TPA: hypothetical protein VGF34_06110 [Stellaceae bacterium]
MSLFVDTSVWSLAFRRDMPVAAGECSELIRAIEAGEELVTTGWFCRSFCKASPGHGTAGKFSTGSPRCHSWCQTGATMSTRLS